MNVKNDFGIHHERLDACNSAAIGQYTECSVFRVRNESEKIA